MNQKSAGIQTNKHIKMSFRILSKTLLYQFGVRVFIYKISCRYKGHHI